MWSNIKPNEIVSNKIKVSSQMDKDLCPELDVPEQVNALIAIQDDVTTFMIQIGNKLNVKSNLWNLIWGLLTELPIQPGIMQCPNCRSGNCDIWRNRDYQCGTRTPFQMVIYSNVNLRSIKNHPRGHWRAIYNTRKIVHASPQKKNGLNKRDLLSSSMEPQQKAGPELKDVIVE